MEYSINDKSLRITGHFVMCAPSGKDHSLCCLPQPTTKLFIDGKFVESKTTEWIDIHNPVSEMASAYIPTIGV